ncbi:hypothetical protein [Spiroplasma endosymbiont of Aspidapion aeneum]|uniref:hypothetical protein n=1 Tax=Spiroplasma endosymbiont of Aspidapion aeneum TaxID=3066276 RepID=UPI00313D7729
MSSYSRYLRRINRIGGSYKRNRANVRQDNMIRGGMGNFLTLKFLASKYVKIMSEGDYVYRVRVLVRSIWLAPFYLMFFCLYIYYKIFVFKLGTLDPSQNKLLNVTLIISGYHLIIISMVIIYFFYQSMGKYCWIFTNLCSVLYIGEVLIICSVFFLAKWGGLLYKYNDISDLLYILRNYWLFIVFYFLVIIFMRPLGNIFQDIDMWKREWERIERFQDTKDKENAFIFKRWITPEEVRARAILRHVAIYGMILSNIFIFIDVFWPQFKFEPIAYFYLIFSYFLYVGSHFFPFNVYSCIYYWLAFIVSTGMFIYSLYMIQEYAYDHYYMYAYFYSIIPWFASLRSAILYGWILKEKPEIKAIVITQFEKPEDFEDYLRELEENKDKLLPTESVDEEKIDYSNNEI